MTFQQILSRLKICNTNAERFNALIELNSIKGLDKKLIISASNALGLKDLDYAPTPCVNRREHANKKCKMNCYE